MRKLTDEELNGSGSDSSDYSSSSSASSVNNSPVGTLRMAARAVLTCRPNSHPFQERNLSLEQPVKIGRSVARARPNGNNAIFDCKVLSRNHALLWHENGKFFLQDTKSSNGTFVNNQRLSKSSEESTPREVCSGDIVQFGVDVMEVNKKLTHGCIVANVQLFLPDGKEAKASSSNTMTDKAATTSLQEVYLLNQFIKDAALKEQMIEGKLAAINKLIQLTRDAMVLSWKSLIEEDRLLTRIDILERQLETSHKSMTDDKLREEVAQLYLDKEKYQNIAKEAIRKSMEEKLEALAKYDELEKNISNWQMERSVLKEMCDKSEDELRLLAEKYASSEAEATELKEEISTSTTKYKEEVENLNKKLKEGEDLLTDKQKVIHALIAKMDSQLARSILAAHNDNTEIILPENDSNKLTNESFDESTNKSFMDNKKNESGDIENLKSQLITAEVEKKEIQSRLIQMLNLFEDLKAVSNKVQVSEYLSDLIGKVDTEIHQIKNFIHGDDISLSIKNNYSINDDVNEINVENHVKRLHSEGTNGLEKLLEDSRETIKALQMDSSSSKRQCENLQEKFNSCAIDLERYKRQVETISEDNSELKSQVLYLQEKLGLSEESEEEQRTKLKKQSEAIAANDRLIATLKGEVSALKSLAENQPQLSLRLNDLNASTSNDEFSEDDFDTTGSSTALNQSTNSDTTGTSDTSKLDESDTDEESEELKQRLLQAEEELAVFKSRYNQSSEECQHLHKKVSDLQSEQDLLSHQSKVGPVRFIIPLIIVLLAILIAFHPST